MSKAVLATCPACERHVRVDEPACPFCSAALPASFREQKEAPSPARRLNRAALHALRMGVLSASAATAACGGSVAGEDAGSYAMPMYGAFVGPEDASDAETTQATPDGSVDDATADGSAVDAAPDAPNVVPLYGGFRGPLDASTDAPLWIPPYGGFVVPVDASTAPDGSETDAGDEDATDGASTP